MVTKSTGRDSKELITRAAVRRLLILGGTRYCACTIILLCSLVVLYHLLLFENRFFTSIIDNPELDTTLLYLATIFLFLCFKLSEQEIINLLWILMGFMQAVMRINLNDFKSIFSNSNIKSKPLELW